MSCRFRQGVRIIRGDWRAHSAIRLNEGETSRLPFPIYQPVYQETRHFARAHCGAPQNEGLNAIIRFWGEGCRGVGFRLPAKRLHGQDPLAANTYCASCHGGGKQDRLLICAGNPADWSGPV